MKHLFILLLALLLLAGFLTYRSMPDVGSTRPILYWVTDANPAREDQIHLFHLWQVKHGHSATRQIASEDDLKSFFAGQGRLMKRSLLEINPQIKPILDGSNTATIEYPLTITLPEAEMRTDTANADLTKRIIQGVSGVGGDVMDMSSGHTMWQLQGMGLLRDVTDAATQGGFGPDKTYKALLPEIAVPMGETGTYRQYMFPCNVVAPGYIVNVETFEKYGLPAPPRRWTIAEFERIGTEFVRRANKGLPRNRFFLAGSIDQSILRRTFGADALNETMTAGAVDDPRSVEAAKTYVRWQNELRLLPSAADRAGFSSDSGYGGQDPQLFNNGNYAMQMTGRYLLIQYRQFNIDRVKKGQPPMKLAVSELPYSTIPITNMGTRAASVYSGGKHQKLAELFLQYLASEDYNMQVVRDADSLPPNPEYTRTPEYLAPAPDPAKGIYPETELGLHQPFAELAETIAVAASHSPFILTVVVQREVGRAEELFINGNADPAEALASAKRRIDAEIARNIEENPKLRPLFDLKVAKQKHIDTMKQTIVAFQQANPGAAVPDELQIPLALLDNPFHRAFYVHQGWARDHTGRPATQAFTEPEARP
jgi:multiple sugar transport system substrate-binding protein